MSGNKGGFSARLEPGALMMVGLLIPNPHIFLCSCSAFVSIFQPGEFHLDLLFACWKMLAGFVFSAFKH